MSKRRTGTTTRIIDRCIQELFKNGYTYIYERTSITDIENKKATDDAHSKMIDRLDREHPYIKYTYKSKTVQGIYCYKVELHTL